MLFFPFICQNLSCRQLRCRCERWKAACHAHAPTNAGFITILPVSAGKLQRGCAVALGLPPVDLVGLWTIITLTCKQHSSRNHHNYKFWSLLWIPVVTETLILDTARRPQDAMVEAKSSTCGAHDWAHQLNRRCSESEWDINMFIFSWGWRTPVYALWAFITSNNSSRFIQPLIFTFDLRNHMLGWIHTPSITSIATWNASLCLSLSERCWIYCRCIGRRGANWKVAHSSCLKLLLKNNKSLKPFKSKRGFLKWTQVLLHHIEWNIMWLFMMFLTVTLWLKWHWLDAAISSVATASSRSSTASSLCH